jgi:hypothetical protein
VVGTEASLEGFLVWLLYLMFRVCRYFALIIFLTG